MLEAEEQTALQKNKEKTWQILLTRGIQEIIIKISS